MEGPTATVEPIDDALGRPVDLSRVWIADKIIAHDVEGDDLADVLQQNGDASAWAVVAPGQVGTVAQMAAVLGLDDLVAEQLLSGQRHDQYDEAGGARLATLHVIGPETESIRFTEVGVSLILADQLLLILAADPVGHQLARTLSRSEQQLADGGPGRAAQLVIRHVLDGYAAVADRLQTRTDSLASELSIGTPLSAGRKLEAFELRRTVIALRRLTEPAREAIDGLAGSENPLGTDERYWFALASRRDRLGEAVAAVDDGLTSIFQASLALDSTHTANITKKFAGWAAIIGVPAVIAGFAGMNVGFWLHNSIGGFYLYLALMLAVAAVLYIVFRIKSWI